MKLYVICGHGDGDSGAVGNGYQEAERVRTLGAKLVALGGDNVILGDVNRNFYKDNGISSLSIPKDYQIIELHMDSATVTARGAHVIIDAKTSADIYDTALAKFLSGLLAGRSNTIVKRDNLANPARAYAMGYAYRLVEIGFISNAEDVAIFNANIDNIAKGILECFGFGTQDTPIVPTPAPQPTPEAPKPTPTPASGKVLHLPQSATSWNVYPTNVAPVVANSCGKLNPSLVSGGLKYDIIGNPQTDVVTIKTRDFGTVNIYVGAGTGATINTVSTPTAPTPTAPVAPKPTPTSNLKVGDWVGVRTGAKDYNGNNAGGVVKGKVWYTLDELKGDRAVLDIVGICTAFNTKDLFK